MTRNANLKKHIRERMARTGERYTTARAHVLGLHAGGADAAPPPAEARLGGEHDQTAALRDLLVAAGVDAPHTGEPPTEALLLGLGGGIGAAVFTFQYAGHLPHLYVETRCHTQYAYTLDFMARAAAALGHPLAQATSGGAKAAAKALDTRLASGAPCAVLVDALALPHHAARTEGGAIPWVLVAHGQEGDEVELTDRSEAPFRLPRAALERARASYRKGKHGLAWLDTPRPVDLRAEAFAALTRCADELDGASARAGFARNFGLAALGKWADEVGAGGKRGYRAIFPPGPALAHGLRQAYGWIETSGTGGGGFRRMYADFLREAEAICDAPALGALATRYDALAGQWTAVAGRFLADGTPLGAIRHLLHARAAAVRAGSGEARLRELDDALDAEVRACEPFPGDAEAVYAGLEAALRALEAEERAAAAALRAAIAAA